MKHPSIKNKSEQDAFTDLLFNALLGFALMFAVAFMLMSTPERKANRNQSGVSNNRPLGG